MFRPFPVAIVWLILPLQAVFAEDSAWRHSGPVCWYDAAVGVSVDERGAVREWRDRSGNGHNALTAAGAPLLATNQVNSRPALQFRTSSGPCGLNVLGPMFVGQQYVVVRSPHAAWNNDGCFLGRRWKRASSYRLSRDSTRFWGDQYPQAVSRNGKKLRGPPFDLGPISEYMVLRIDVNDGDMSNNSYQIGMADSASCDCDIAEILGFQAALSPVEEAAVGSYLAAKYGIAASWSTNGGKAPAGPLPQAAETTAVGAARTGSAAPGSPPKLPVTKGLACWFDAGAGLAADGRGAVQEWKDLSGHDHHARPGGGVAPLLASRRVGSRPAVQFRKGWLALDGTFFAKEHYLVVRSPARLWSGAGGLLGRLKGRGSSYNTWGKDTGFWQDQFPAAVARNGIVLPGPAFDCSPLTRFMVLKIIVNAFNETDAAYAIGNNDGLAGCDFDVAEILGYRSMLSPADEARVGGYLAAKYGIAAAYPPWPSPGAMAAALPPSAMAAVKYRSWRHSGSLYLLTTPEGADLPATAAEEHFPVLVRFDKDWFDFGQANPGGEDIRFASRDGAPLAYQIDEWDAATGRASVWVRVPAIQGNARQEIKVYWGNADAASESNGPAVFNRSNGCLCVWHMNDPVRDAAGTVDTADLDTTPSPAVIGRGRHFGGGKGIGGGEQIRSFPFASSPHTSEAWVKVDKFNAAILSWGKQDMVNLRVTPTAHLAVETGKTAIYSSGTISKSRWLHAAYTYDGQNGRIYINGRLDVPFPTPAPAALEILTPVRLQIGHAFTGDLDEVRVSNVARSADWMRLQYENQKRLQTLVGPLVQPGAALAVSPAAIAIDEGQSVTVAAQAGGAEKLYWIVNRGDRETPAAVDRFHFTLDAGRVAQDQSFALSFKAVYADRVRSVDIPVTIRKVIPDPVFTVQVPASWDGRQTIEIVPQISNLAAMQAKGAGRLCCEWSVPSLVEAQDILPGKLVLHRARNSGKLRIAVAVSNGGPPVTRVLEIAVKEPKIDAWVSRTPEKDEKPEEGQFYARDDKNEGTLYCNGRLDAPAAAVFLKVYADDKLFATETKQLPADRTYAFTVKLKPGLIVYRVEFGTKTGEREKLLDAAGDLVCGDAFLIDGQSNALATDTGERSPPDTSPWIRSYGGLAGRGDASDWVRDRMSEARRAGLARPNLWCRPVWKAEHGEKAELGYWGMELAKRLVASRKMPLFVVNGAVGGTRIDEHQPAPRNRADLKTIYGRMIWRVRQARLTHGIRAVLWHQGEADQGSDGPDGGYGWETYQRYFLDMSAAWKRDMPNIQHYYVFQIWPNGCGQGGGHGDMLREVQRTLPRHYSNMDVMPTLGIKPPGGCHYPLAGWAEFARLMQPLIERDIYGKTPAASITAPNLKRAYYAGSSNDAIALEFDQPLLWNDSLTGQFYLDDAAEKVASGAVSGNVVTLKLKQRATAGTITYLKEMNWSQDKLLIGTNGIAALSFCNVAIAPSAADGVGWEGKL